MNHIKNLPMTQPCPSLQLITNQQRAVLEHIFTYRFITITHLQIILGHTHKHRIQVWLNNLMTKDYIHQIYNKKPQNYRSTCRLLHRPRITRDTRNKTSRAGGALRRRPIRLFATFLRRTQRVSRGLLS